MWQRHIHLPRFCDFERTSPNRLRIVDHEQVFGKLHALAVLLAISHKDVLDLLRQVVVAAVQRVVEAFCDLKKIIAAGDHVPARGNFQLIHQRNQAVQDFCHASAHGGGVDHLDCFAAKMARQKADLIQLRLADDRRIIFKSRRSGNGRLLCADARMLAALNKMGRQIRLPETAFYSRAEPTPLPLHRALA